MAKKIVTGNGKQVDPADVITQEEANELLGKRGGYRGGQKFESTPWHRRKQVIPVLMKEIVTPSGGSATLIVDVRMADNSANAKIRAGRVGRNEDEEGNSIKDKESGEEIVKINSMDFWVNDIPALLSMIKEQYNAAQQALLAEAERRLEEKRQSITLL